jgi:hypothetical protein
MKRVLIAKCLGDNEMQPISGQPPDGIVLLAELFFFLARKVLIANCLGANNIEPISCQPLDVRLVWRTIYLPTRSHS